MATTDNLILGSAEIFTAPVGTAHSPGSTTGWTSLGHTTAAVTLSDSPSYVKASSQQSARTLDVGISSIETTVTTTLREIDAARLASMVNGSNNLGTIAPGGLGLAPKFALLVKGAGPSGGTIELHAPRAVYTGDRSLSWDAESFSEVEVTIEVLDDHLTGGYTVYVSAGASQSYNGGGESGGGESAPPPADEGNAFSMDGGFVSESGDTWTVTVGDLFGSDYYISDEFGVTITGWGTSGGYDDSVPGATGSLSTTSFSLGNGITSESIDITGGGNINSGDYIFLYYNASNVNTGETVATGGSVMIATPPPA